MNLFYDLVKIVIAVSNFVLSARCAHLLLSFFGNVTDEAKGAVSCCKINLNDV